MRFGPVPVAEAGGAILAHSVGVDGGRLRKGRVLDADDLALLQAAGLERVTVARLDPGDVAEDAAAARLAAALVPDPAAAALEVTAPFTGRVNLNATGPGVAVIDERAVHALNRIDPAITLATLPPFQRVTAGTLVGTVKIIAYAVPGAALDAACAVARGAVRVQPVVLRTAALIVTRIPGQTETAARKGETAIAGRLEALGMALAEIRVVPHEAEAIAAALTATTADMALILTGSATSDLHDTAPEGVRQAGGTVARYGMPVDPGNLLFVGSLGTRPVVGLPGCARSPALNGADWVIERLACGFAVGDAEIAGMGVGGLLKEIPIRPQPRERRR